MWSRRAGRSHGATSPRANRRTRIIVIHRQRSAPLSDPTKLPYIHRNRIFYPRSRPKNVHWHKFLINLSSAISHGVSVRASASSSDAAASVSSRAWASVVGDERVPAVRVRRVRGRGSPPGGERGEGRGRRRGRRERRGRRRLGRGAPSLRVLALPYAVRLQLVVDEVVLRFALLAAVLAREPLVAVGLRVHVEHVLAQVGRGRVHAAAQRTLRPVAQRPARQSRPCNTEAAVRDNTTRVLLSATVCVSVEVGGRGEGRGRGRGGRGVAAALLDAVDGVHMYLHVLARLEGAAAGGAAVAGGGRGVHV